LGSIIVNQANAGRVAACFNSGVDEQALTP
jgi:hypothetical protein